MARVYHVMYEDLNGAPHNCHIPAASHEAGDSGRALTLYDADASPVANFGSRQLKSWCFKEQEETNETT